MVRSPVNRRGARQRRDGVDQIDRGVSRATSLTIIAVLIEGLAFRAAAFNKTIGQKQSLVSIIGLGDFSYTNMALLLNALVNGF